MSHLIHRGRLLIVHALVLVTGLASRTFARPWSPEWLLLYGGDALWAATLYGFFLWLFQSKGPRWLFLWTVITAFVVECSQLYQAPWLQALRQTFPLQYVLGHGFLLTDLLAYLLGASVMCLTHYLCLRQAST
ncbi:MAG: DUF2809 domain-containing protein [Verrucomicrobiota bacterium]|jgi:hypothetical protein|nr:DUF2809 domain-containing protein [Verrucomicrobiota bacterium]